MLDTICSCPVIFLQIVIIKLDIGGPYSFTVFLIFWYNTISTCLLFSMPRNLNNFFKRFWYYLSCALSSNFAHICLTNFHLFHIFEICSTVLTFKNVIVVLIFHFLCRCLMTTDRHLIIPTNIYWKLSLFSISDVKMTLQYNFYFSSS